LEWKILDLHTKNAELKLKFKNIENLMTSDEEVNEEGPVGNLVRLSQKIKSIVKAILI
jgi:hypothetical protein